MTGSVSISLVRINSSKWHISIHVYGRMHSDGIRSNRLKFNTLDDKRSEKRSMMFQIHVRILCANLSIMYQVETAT